MASDSDRQPRKEGQKKSREQRSGLRQSLDFPERLRVGNDVQEDAARPGLPARGQYMNQSVFSIITAAAPKIDFHARFDNDSSDSDDNASADEAAGGAELSPTDLEHKYSKERRKSKSSKLSRVLPALGLRSKDKKGKESPQSSGKSSEKDDHSDFARPAKTTSNYAPVMSRMLEAKEKWTLEEQGPKGEAAEQSSKQLSALSERLQEIFGLPNPEEVKAEYPCWLLQNVLMQGYMYITGRHVCFYAYLPKKSHVVTKSGHLQKKARQTSRYHRYWFQLKGDVLSYYADPSDLYFPAGNVDLRFGISAAITESKNKKEDSKEFSVTTDSRTYVFKADSAASAKEWVKSLQKVIFRSHNEGDSVKISLPIDNIIDIEESPVLDFADTFKIRVVDQEETFAIEEYFFSFFGYGKEAFYLLQSLTQDTTAKKIPEDLLESPGTPNKSRSHSRSQSRDGRRHSRQQSGISDVPILAEAVHATLTPNAGPRAARSSGEYSRSAPHSRVRSMDAGRYRSKDALPSPARKHELSLSEDETVPSKTDALESEDSYVLSVDRETSGSQILRGSDVLFSPTVNKRRTDSNSIEHLDSRTSIDSARSAPTGTDPSKKLRLVVPDAQQSDKDPQNRFGSISATSLHDIVKSSTYPLQRAAGFAEYLRNHSKRVGSALASESMGYLEKVSGMWAGNRKHYDKTAGMDLADTDDEQEKGDTVDHEERFRKHFALPPGEKLQASYYAHLHRVLPLYGKIYLSNRHFCFRSLLPGTRTKFILPLRDIENVDKEKGFRFGYSGLVVVIRGHEEIFFEFSQAEARDDCCVSLLLNLEGIKYLKESGLLTREELEDVEVAKAENQMLQEARKGEHESKLPIVVESPSQSTEQPPVLFDDPRASIINFKPTESLRVTCLTIGSRGDVQPYIALCKGLIKEGHKAKIATHAEFREWIESHGIEFAQVEGDPAELMRICVENGMFTYSFLREASVKFRSWIDELLSSAWTACQNSDILIESPSAMAGIHIAEALEIPYFRAFTMPWTRTRAYPHAFAVPEHKMGGAYNYFTYVMFDNVFWKAIAGQVNRWRKKELNLPSTNLDKLQPNKVPFLYNFSPGVVVPPLDYSDWIRVTGYWFLDEETNFKPPKEITDFIAKAREEKKKIVYVGFGSIVVSDPAALTKTVVESVLKADVRCILSKGWSDRLGSKDSTEAEIQLPKEILQIKSAPHDWLFKQIDAAVHHGGAGTTGASLRAGLPTIVKPFFGDQFFFGSRIEDLGVGICVKKLNVSVFSRALWQATQDERMITKARVLGENIRAENGVETAIQAIYRDMEYAKTLVKRRNAAAENDTDDWEESWTFIGNESDPELTKRIMEWDPTAHHASISAAT